VKPLIPFLNDGLASANGPKQGVFPAGLDVPIPTPQASRRFPKEKAEQFSLLISCGYARRSTLSSKQ
jgi:hypothetical protein